MKLRELLVLTSLGQRYEIVWEGETVVPVTSDLYRMDKDLDNDPVELNLDSEIAYINCKNNVLIIKMFYWRVNK